MATLPKTGACEEWLQMPVTRDGREGVVNGEIRITPPNKFPHPVVMRASQAAFRVLHLKEGKLRRSAILADGVLKPKHFPAVQIDVSRIWSD